MPIIPSQRSLPPYVLDRHSATEIDCLTLYTTLEDKMSATDVVISCQPGCTLPDESWEPGQTFTVPREPLKLGFLFSDTYTECKIFTKFMTGANGFDSQERLTRLEFVMQTLDIYERMMTEFEAVGKGDSEVAKELVISLEIFKSTYGFHELLPAGLTMNRFKNYFSPDANKEENN